MTCLEHRGENIAFVLGDFSFNNESVKTLFEISFISHNQDHQPIQ